MKILETSLKQREYDKQWMLMARVPDYENSYRHRGEDGKYVTWTPDMWIILDVKADKNKLKRSRRTNT